MTGRAAVFVALLAGLVAAAPPPGDDAPPRSLVGREAPEFTLPDLDGDPVSLREFRDTVLVLQWFNADCPFNARVYRDGTVQRTLDALRKHGEDAAYLAVNSTAVRSEEALVAESRALLEDVGIEVPVLIDADGVVGRRYDARTTPHVFVIERGVVRYAGAFTDDPWNARRARNHVVSALERIRGGQPVDPAETRPWGCTVKYRRTPAPP